MPEKQGEETLNGDYEELKYRTFEAVDYDRIMRWTRGDGYILFAKASHYTNDDNLNGKTLPAGDTVVVWKTNFKLSKT